MGLCSPRSLIGLALAVTILCGNLLRSADDKKADDPKPAAKDPVKDNLKDFAKKLGDQVKANAPPDWKARQDLHGDPLPTGVLARLGTARYRHGSSITSIAYSADGKLLASGGSDKRIRIFDAASGKEIR